MQIKVLADGLDGVDWIVARCKTAFEILGCVVA
jgi:hypothetical protein